MRDIKAYEAMAKLTLPEEERQQVLELVHTLLNSFKALEAVDTEGVAPMVTVLNVQNILREDNSEKMLTREELLENAPVQHDGYFQVPKTL